MVARINEDEVNRRLLLSNINKENSKMPDITIRTQAEFDALPESFEEHTLIIILNDPTAGRIIIRGNRGNASVKAYGNASVVAQDNASVWAWDNASVVAQDNASVWAWDNASVEAWGNASVEAYGNASIVAWGNASVRAYDNASVQAYDNSSVVAHNQAAIRRYSAAATITLHDSSACWDMLSSPAKISSLAEFSKHTNPVVATIPAAAKLTEDQKTELFDQYSSCQNRWMNRVKVLKKFVEDTVIPIFLSNKRNVE
jgi:hypothetical protein